MGLRKIGFIAALLSFWLSFIGELPFNLSGDSPDSTLKFSILMLENIEYYSWGYIMNNAGYATIGLNSLEGVAALFIWLLILLPGIMGIMASSPHSISANSKKIFKINALLLFLSIFLYTTNYILLFFPDPTVGYFGVGYYFLYLIFTLNIIAINRVEK